MEFLSHTLSRYSGKFSFQFGLTQEDVLCYHMDPEEMMQYQDRAAECMAQYRVYDQNPLNLGFPLSSLTPEGNAVVLFLINHAF